MTLAIALVPVAVAFVVSLVVVRSVPRPNSGMVLVLWWLLILITPWVIYAGVRRVARRALPMAALLRMTLVFPDKAPSRVAVARKAGGTKALERQLARDREEGRHDEPVVAAERILGLATSLNKHDRLTRGHSERVRALTDVIATQLKLSPSDMDRLRWAALLHDIGKLTVPVAILNKPERLDDDEAAVIRQHPTEGARLAAPLAGWLGEWARSIPEHHEKFDGTGYPLGLSGEEISLGGRIVAVADAFETMTAVRSYKKAMSTEDARRELTACAGTHFDPAIVRAFLEASLGERRFLGAPLVAVADLSRVDVVQQMGQALAGVSQFAAGVVVVAGVATAAVFGAAHTGPHSGPAAAATPNGASSPTHASSVPPTARPGPPPGTIPTASTTSTTSTAPKPSSTPPPITPPPSSTPTSTTSTTSPVVVAVTTSVPAAPTTTTQAVAPSALPGAPTGLSVVGGDDQAALTWNPPAHDGGSAIVAYLVTPYIGGVAQPSVAFAAPGTVQTLTGLINGTSYTFTVSTITAVGKGPSSVHSPAVTPATHPGAPTSVSATAGNRQAIVAWPTSAVDGGAPITGYTVIASDLTTPANGDQTATGLVSPVTMSGLTNGDSYAFVVTATNRVGTSPSSPASSAVTPATIPDAPSTISATAGDRSASVTWAAPSDEGSPITGYTVTATDATTPANGGQTVIGSVGPLTMDGLTNGDSYTFTVTATNALGTSSPSPASSPVTPTAVPGVPSGVSATAGDASATVTWTAPSDEGSPITGYTVTAIGDGTDETCSTSTSACTVTGLTNGDSYTFTVTATNALGTSSPSPASSSVTPATVPGVPSGVSATAGDASATVSWTAPSDEGSPITGYTVTATGDGTAETCSTSGSACTVTGLTNGDSYTFTVTATNALGTSSPSPASSSVTPATVPGVPSGASAAAGDASATVSWVAPASDGGSPVTGYTVLAVDSTDPANGGETCSWTTGALACTVTGLTNSDSYSFTVTATNLVGQGTSAMSNAIVPGTVPDPPVISLITPGVASATISWIAPLSDGGAPITSYTVAAGDVTTPTNGGQTCKWTAGPLTCTVTGLTAGDTYVLGVSATNDVGTSTTVISGFVIPLP